MKILLINGSPRGEKSNTLNISRAFVSGFVEGSGGCEAEEITLSKLDIQPCRGCFSCWGKTAGSCVIKDDMDMLKLKIQLSDIIVESFPLYFFGMPSTVKAMTDRCLPMMLPYSGGKEGLFHELRDKEMKKKKLVIISSCGYAETESMYKALVGQLDLIYGEGKYTKLFCAQGELFFSGMAERQRKAYLSLVKEAGKEFCDKGEISEELIKKLDKPLLSAKGFETVTKGHKEWFGA